MLRLVRDVGHMLVDMGRGVGAVNELKPLAVLLSLLLPSLAAVAAPASASAPEHVSTEITIAFDEVNGVDTLSGVVNGDDLPVCVNREVEVYRKKGGPDQLFARTVSTRTKYGYGLWGIDRDRLPHGKYYALVRKQRGHGTSGAVLCEADRSEAITAP
jgi:hypothetical protein